MGIFAYNNGLLKRYNGGYVKVVTQTLCSYLTYFDLGKLE